MSIKQRDVLLFGSEAVLPWNAPTTDSLTKMILTKGFRKRNNTTVTSLIYKKLKAKINNKKVTFETILHFIDQLYNYSIIRKNMKSYITTQLKPKSDSYSLSEAEKDIRLFTEYTIADVNEDAGTYSMIIPGYNKQKEYNISIKVSPPEKYFELLYAELAKNIIECVSKYSYHTEGRDMIFTKENESLNKLFTKYIKLKTKYVKVRMYSLGYDRIFKILSSKARITVFEGYNVDNSYVKYNETLTPDIKKIISDTQCNCFYNLHGSAYWKIEKVKPVQHPDYQFYLTPGDNKQDSTISLDVLKERRMIASNILTDYHEAQKIVLSPYRQMYAAFERDCLECRHIFLIGYKFGDEYINEILRTVRRMYPNVTINLIDLNFDENNEMIKFLMNWNAPKGYNYWSSIKDLYAVSGDMRFHISVNTFEDYMKSLTS